MTWTMRRPGRAARRSAWLPRMSLSHNCRTLAPLARTCATMALASWLVLTEQTPHRCGLDGAWGQAPSVL
jgi:hypothetical protein